MRKRRRNQLEEEEKEVDEEEVKGKVEEEDEEKSRKIRIRRISRLRRIIRRGEGRRMRRRKMKMGKHDEQKNHNFPKPYICISIIAKNLSVRLISAQITNNFYNSTCLT